MAEYENQVKPANSLSDAVPYTELLPNCDECGLTIEEIEHFKEFGFLVKRRLVDSPKVFDRIVDHVWDTMPGGVMSRHEPRTWIDLPHERWPKSAASSCGILHGSAWKMRSKHRYGRETFILDATANHPNVRATVAQFIGEKVMACERVRGVYVVLPKPTLSEGRLGPHVDHSAAQLSAMVIVEETPPRTGGFTIWPGSHHRLHSFWTSRQGAHFEPSMKDAFDTEFRSILSDTPPLEFIGEPGDVVFWHPRLIHSAGVNYSADTSTPRIRYVVPCDFQKAGRTLYDDDDLGPSADVQWWVDTRHFREDPRPTQENMWGDWAI